MVMVSLYQKGILMANPFKKQAVFRTKNKLTNKKPMKKLLFCMLIFAASTSLAQTKEETIAWLKEKLEVAADHYDWEAEIDWISINECEIIIKYTCEGTTYEMSYTEYIPLEGLLIKNDGYRSLFWLNYEGIKRINTYYTYQDGTSAGSLSADSFHQWSDIKINETEPNLHERIIKAINHLSTFCVEEEEPF